jgi:histidine ammonia-lyase
LRREGRTSQRAHDIADELRRSIQDGYTASSEAQQGIYGALLSVMDQLEEDRDTRLIVRTDLPLILWVALVVLGTIIVGFAAMADMENRPIHLLAVCSLSTSIAVVFFTIFVLDYPFRTDINPVGPQPFESVLQEMEGNDT